MHSGCNWCIVAWLCFFATILVLGFRYIQYRSKIAGGNKKIWGGKP